MTKLLFMENKLDNTYLKLIQVVLKLFLALYIHV